LLCWTDTSLYICLAVTNARNPPLRGTYCSVAPHVFTSQTVERILPLTVGRLSKVRLRVSRGQLKRDGTRSQTTFRLSAKRTSPFKSAGGGRQFSRLLRSRGVRISGSNAGYTVFRGSVKGTGYPLHSPVSPSLPRPCVTVCLHF